MLKFGQNVMHRSRTSNGGIVAPSAMQAAGTSVNFDFTKDPVPQNITPFQCLLRNVDWSTSGFGPMSTWCRELRQMVRFMTADVSPIILYWGPSRTMIYNEAYIPLIGDKHPSILGQNAADVFPEFWPYFESILTEISEEGITQTGVGSMLLMQRHGFLEETYFDWKLVPIIGDDGLVQGAYGMPTESTVEVIGTRRTSAIQAISSRMSKAANVDDVWRATIDGLKENDRDVPFALLYATEQPNRTNSSASNDNYEFELKGTIGVPSDAKVLDKFINTQNDCGGFASVMLEAIESGNNVVVDASDVRVADLMKNMDWKGFGIPCHQFVCVPINTGYRIAAVIVFGLNPRRRYNEWYRSFLQLVTDVVAPSIAKLRLSEELKHRAELAQRALQNFEQSEMRFSRFAARSAIGLAVTDLQGQVLYANDAWYTFAGIDPNEGGFTSWMDSVVEEDIETLHHWWHKVTVLKQSGTFQFRSKQPFKNGDMTMPHKTGICACYADLDANGEVETVMGLIIDISELKWTEEQLVLKSKALEESEAKYRTFAEHAPLGVVRTDQNGYVEFGNDAWHDFYGFKKGFVPDAQPWLPYIHSEDIPRARDFFDTLSARPGPLTVELRLRRSYSITEGDRIIENDAWVLATGVSENGPNGSVDHIDFWVTDISSQKMAAKVLTDKMEEAVRMRTQQERFIDMISHEIRNPLSACLSCSEQVIEAMEDSLKTMDAFPDANSIPAKQAFLQDDMRRHIDNALDAANTIMYCVQHQKQIVDDVLTLSKLDSDLLVVSPVPVEPLPLVKRSLKIFEPELKMSQIGLSITEHESLKRLGIEWIMLDPNRFLQIVINLITNAIKFTRTSNVKKIDVRVSAKTKRPFGDDAGVDFVPRLYSVKRNPSIVDINAKSPNDRVFLCISVSDSGKGLTAKEKTILFNRFAQASPKTHVEYGGSGLGLFISRQITEMLGGEIGVGDSPDNGCTFAFYVETTKIEPPGQTLSETNQLGGIHRVNSAPHLSAGQAGLLQPHPQTIKTSSTTNILPTPARKVLVVEDNLINQKVLCKQLRNRGFIVEATNHGKEALSALEKCQRPERDPKLAKFDIILCDIEMPVMNGIECVQEIRKMEQSGHLLPHIPIIGVTANVRSKQVDAAVEAGMDGVTTKPYRMDELLAHIDRVCPTNESKG